MLNEELGRHRGKNGDRQCKLCGDECESVVHVLWECPALEIYFHGSCWGGGGGGVEEFS